MIRCRAKLDERCLDGARAPAGRDWRDDGTWEEAGDTVVCDHCYLTVMPYTGSGRGLLAELPRAIEAVREERAARRPRAGT